MIKRLTTVLTVLAMVPLVDSQAQTLDEQKYAECKLLIPIDYKNVENDFQEAKKYEGVELVLVQTNGKNKIKSVERGFLKTYERNGKRGTFFQPAENINSPQVIAKFPILNSKKMFCYKAECYDLKNR